MKQSPDKESVTVADDISNIKVENDDIIVFTRNKIIESQKQPATETLHFFDKNTGIVTDIFTDSWVEYNGVRATSGRVLGVWADGGGRHLVRKGKHFIVAAFYGKGCKIRAYGMFIRTPPV